MKVKKNSKKNNGYVFLYNINEWLENLISQIDYNQMEHKIPESIINNLISYEFEMEEIRDLVNEKGSLDSYF